MQVIQPFGRTSVILRVKIGDSTSPTGAGKTGLTNASSGLIISTIADVEATATAYTVAASHVQTITTLGTYAAPTTGNCRFKEVDAVNHPGLYEIQLANVRYAVPNASSLVVTISGVAGIVQTDAVIQTTGTIAGFYGTAVSGGANSITLDSGASSSDGIYVNQLIAINPGTANQQVRKVVSYVSRMVTVDFPWVAPAPTAGTPYNLPGVNPLSQTVINTTATEIVVQQSP